MMEQPSAVPAPAGQRVDLKWPAKLGFLFAKKMPDGQTPIRYKVAYGGRAGLKSWGYARALLMHAAKGPERVLCAREYQNSIKESVHKLLADQITALGMNYLFEVLQVSIKCPSTKSEFFFEGLHGNIDKIKSIEGVTKCWVEEANNVEKSSFQILDPTIRAAESEIWISFNPQLETDFIYDHFVLHTPKNAWVQKTTWQDNPWLPEVMRVQIEALRESNEPGAMDDYLHIWEGHCRQMLEGAVYAEELRAARASGRIMAVPYEPTKPVETIWDLGHADETAIWFRQLVGFEWHYIDYYHNSQKKLGHYFEAMQARRSSFGQPYFYGTLWLPHDAKAQQLGTQKSIEEQAKAMWGPRQVRIVPKLRLADGINATRTHFPACYFDQERCADGLQALSHYRYEVVEESTGRLSKEPVHDAASHGADAFRYGAVASKMPKGQSQIREKLQEAAERQIAEGIVQHGRPFGRAGSHGWMRN